MPCNNFVNHWFQVAWTEFLTTGVVNSLAPTPRIPYTSGLSWPNILLTPPRLIVVVDEMRNKLIF